MFEKSITINLEPMTAFNDSCSSMLERVKVLPDSTMLIFENNYDLYTVRRIDLQGNLLGTWSVTDSDGLLIDYIYINDIVYMLSLNSVSEYDEVLNIYRSENGKTDKIVSQNRESYQHDMDYFNLFEYNNECRLLLIRHNRIHLYSLDKDGLKELNVLEGQRWYISGRYVLCSMGGRDWELYNSEFELLTTFKYEESVDWLCVDESKDGQIIAMATDNTAGEIGGMIIFDRQANQTKVHYQRHGFYNIAVCGSKIWTTISSIYSDIGGLMIFDKSAGLKFAHLRDEVEGDAIRAYQPSPLIYQAIDIKELADGKVLLTDYDKMIVTDITCRLVQEIKHPGYDCYAISTDSKSLMILNLPNRLYGSAPETKYDASIDVYQWDVKKKARVVDLSSFRK